MFLKCSHVVGNGSIVGKDGSECWINPESGMVIRKTISGKNTSIQIYNITTSNGDLVANIEQPIKSQEINQILGTQHAKKNN